MQKRTEQLDPAGGGFPSFQDVCEMVAEFARRHPDIARMTSLGRSDEGREVLAVEVTDPGVPLETKQVAMVVCGRHGNELGTRVIGSAVLEWLASEDAAETRTHQLVVVVPVANPDGCVRDAFLAPNDGLSDAERRTVMALAERTQPDAIVDVHSLGGNDIEAVIAAHTGRSGVDAFTQAALATEIADAAGRGGYPFDLEGVTFSNQYNNFLAGECYDRFHSVALGMEVNHLALRPDQAADSGVVAISSFLRSGNRRRYWQAHPGYPNDLIIGNFSTSIRPAGSDAASRRSARVALWQNRRFFDGLKRTMPDSHTVKVVAQYTGGPLQTPWTLCCRLRGRPVVRDVRLNGEPVQCETFTDACSTYVSVVAEATGPERYELLVGF